MPRQTLERELQRLKDEILSLGSLVESALLNSVSILKERDLDRARRLIADDQLVNNRRLAIESDCLTLIATQQPMAGDLRHIAAMLEIAGELERISDYAKGIAKITLMRGNQPHVKPLLDIPRMARCTQLMLHDALLAFSRRDISLARAIPEADDEVDALYNQIYRELMTLIVADPEIIDQANSLLWAAHNLERAADRVINICERVIFTVTGELVELDTGLKKPPFMDGNGPHDRR